MVLHLVSATCEFFPTYSGLLSEQSFRQFFALQIIMADVNAATAAAAELSIHEANMQDMLADDTVAAQAGVSAVPPVNPQLPVVAVAADIAPAEVLPADGSRPSGVSNSGAPSGVGPVTTDMFMQFLQAQTRTNDLLAHELTSLKTVLNACPAPAPLLVMASRPMEDRWPNP